MKKATPYKRLTPQATYRCVNIPPYKKVARRSWDQTRILAAQAKFELASTMKKNKKEIQPVKESNLRLLSLVIVCNKSRCKCQIYVDYMVKIFQNISRGMRHYTTGPGTTNCAVTIAEQNWFLVAYVLRLMDGSRMGAESRQNGNLRQEREGSDM